MTVRRFTAGPGSAADLQAVLPADMAVMFDRHDNPEAASLALTAVSSLADLIPEPFDVVVEFHDAAPGEHPPWVRVQVAEREVGADAETPATPPAVDPSAPAKLAPPPWQK